jgi:aspartate-semialdehyde dehydrogenase
MAGDGYRVGVVGATGLVGTTILDLLAARDFPVSEVIPFASRRSAGKAIEWGEEELEVHALSDEAIQGLDLVLSSAGGAVSAEWTPKLVEAGAVVVDNTSYWRMRDDVPLVVAEVNPDALAGHRGIVANPNCSTMQMVVALKPLYDAAGIERLVISTYQAVSGTGKAAIDELRAQSRAALERGDIAAASVYPHPIAFNALPQAGSFPEGDDHTDEERKLINETRKILDDEEIRVSATCVRVPVVTGHSEAVNVETREPLAPERARELLAAAPGVTVLDDPATASYPTAIDAAGRDDVFVGRIRRDPGNERALDLWIVSDNLRKGAATNTVQIAELLVERGLLGRPSALRAPGRG